MHSSKTGQTPTEPILLMPSPPAVHTGKKYPEGSLKGKELSPVLLALGFSEHLQWAPNPARTRRSESRSVWLQIQCPLVLRRMSGGKELLLEGCEAIPGIEMQLLLNKYTENHRRDVIFAFRANADPSNLTDPRAMQRSLTGVSAS